MRECISKAVWVKELCKCQLWFCSKLPVQSKRWLSEASFSSQVIIQFSHSSAGIWPPKVRALKALLPNIFSPNFLIQQNSNVGPGSFQLKCIHMVISANLCFKTVPSLPPFNESPVLAGLSRNYCQNKYSSSVTKFRTIQALKLAKESPATRNIEGSRGESEAGDFAQLPLT